MYDSMIGKRWDLHPSEVRLAKAVAEARFRSNREAGVANSKVGEQSDDYTDLNGFGAELAFCHLFRCCPDFTIEPRSSQKGEDTKSDTILVTGHTVDVKQTKYLTGRLLAVPWKNYKSVDLFALMVGEVPSFAFKGFMSSGDLVHPSRLTDLGHGPTYAADQYELGEFGKLLISKGIEQPL